MRHKIIRRWMAILLTLIFLVGTLSTTAFAMQIFVKITIENRHITLEVEPTDRIEEVKEKIQDREGIPSELQILTFNGIELEDDNTLQDYSIQKDGKLFLSVKAVAYLDETGTQQTLTENYSIINQDKAPTEWTTGWYVAAGDVTIDSRVTVNGDVKLILQDGANLTVDGGIDVSDGNSFTVYAQSAGEDTMGALIANGNQFNAGIGGGDGTGYGGAAGSITINGGKITATGGYEQAAGIGGSNRGFDIITINGGIVEATGSVKAPGIGGSAFEGSVIINGGSVTATGGSYSPGLGGGRIQVLINGGDVTAKGGSIESGIGGGGSVTINGGHVTAIGNISSGIEMKTTTINGGIVDTRDGNDTIAGIGDKFSKTTNCIAGGIVYTTDIYGTFYTGQNGTAVIFASSIADQTSKDSWSGLIFEGSQGKIYGQHYTLSEPLTIPDGNTLTVEEGKTLTVSSGAALTNQGVLQVDLGGTYSGAQPAGNPVTYQIGWDIDGDGSADETEYLPYGATPSHEDVSQDADAQYTYTFDGWTPALSEVTEPVTYTAQFSSDVRNYTVMLPEHPVGYSVSSDGSTSVGYDSDFTFTVEPEPGYYKGTDFAVKADGQVLTPNEDGSYTVHVLGDVQITIEGIVRETTPEAPTVDTNGYDSEWTASNVMLTPSATADSGIAYYEYSKDGGMSWIKLTGDSLTISESDFETDYLFRAVSNAGNVSGASQPVTVRVDKQAPKVSLSGNTMDYCQQDTLQIVPIVGLSGISRVELKNADGTWTALSPSEDSQYLYYYPITENGTYTFRAISGTGVEGIERSITYTRIDSVKPVVSISSGDYESGTWSNQDVTLSVSNTADNLGTTTFQYKVGDGNWQPYTSPITVSEETEDAVYTFQAISASGVVSDEASITVNLDKTAPDGDITFQHNSVKQLINQITFGLFFNRNVDVEISATDAWGQVDTIEYYRSDKVLTEAEVQAITGWTQTDGTFSVTAEDQAQFIYYVKITDQAGNSTCFGSDGAAFDLIPPAISGVEDGGTYYTTQKVAVSDANLADVTLNGVADDAALTLTGNVAQTYTIAATDRAGNRTEYIVTMKPIESLADAIEGVTTGNVTYEDKAEIEGVQAAVASVDQTTATEEEKAELDKILDDCEALLTKLEEAAQAGESESIQKVENITSDHVGLEDKDDLTAAKEDLEDALEHFGDNYTEEEKAALEEKLEQVNEALESIGKAETVKDAITALPDTAEPDDTATEALIHGAQEQYDGLTEHEKTLIPEELKEKLESLLGALLDYRIVAGNGIQWTVGDDSSITLTANGPLEKFVGITVDGTAVDGANFTVKSGSTIITLQPDYLNTLSVGKHTLTVIYRDGEASGTFEILKQAETTAPKTGDDSNAGLWMTFLFLAACGLTGTTVYSRRKKQSK